MPTNESFSRLLAATARPGAPSMVLFIAEPNEEPSLSFDLPTFLNLFRAGQGPALDWKLPAQTEQPYTMLFLRVGTSVIRHVPAFADPGPEPNSWFIPESKARAAALAMLDFLAKNQGYILSLLS